MSSLEVIIVVPIPSVRVEISGEFACFTRPEAKVERVSSPLMTPSAARNILGAICWRPEMRWVVTSISVLSPIRYSSVLRYEVQSKLSPTSVKKRMAEPEKYEPLAAGAGAKRAWMCENFFGIRAFGAVMSTTEFNRGQVRGPVQLAFSRSIDRILTTEHTIVRQAFTGEKDIKSGTGTFDRKHTVAHGLYRTHGFINPVFAGKTGFSEDDLAELWKA